MNKKELIEAVADGTDVTRTTAGQAVDAVLETIAGRLAAGESVTIPGFGTFEVRQRGARTGRNPRTGETIEIAASRSAAFKSRQGAARPPELTRGPGRQGRAAGLRSRSPSHRATRPRGTRRSWRPDADRSSARGLAGGAPR